MKAWSHYFQSIPLSYTLKDMAFLFWWVHWLLLPLSFCEEVVSQETLLKRELEELRREVTYHFEKAKASRKPDGLPSPEPEAYAHPSLLSSETKPGALKVKETLQKGLALEQSKQAGEAIIVFAEVLNLAPEDPLAPYALFLTARCYEQLKETKLALREYDNLVLKYPFSPWTSEGLAQKIALQRQLGQNAQTTLETLKTLFPASPALQKAMKPNVVPATVEAESAS